MHLRWMIGAALATLLAAAPAMAQPGAAGAVVPEILLPGAAPLSLPPAQSGVPGSAVAGPAEAPPTQTGRPAGPEILPGVLDSQIEKCWSAPVMTGDPAEGGIARIRVTFQPDGTLAGPPAIIDKPAGRLGLVFAESAARAITACAPYRLPPESYESWKELMLEFDTLNF